MVHRNISSAALSPSAGPAGVLLAPVTLAPLVIPSGASEAHVSQVVKELLATVSGSQHSAAARIEALRKLGQCCVDSPIARRVVKLENGVQLLARTCAVSTDVARELAIVALQNLATSAESCAFLVSRGGLEGVLAVLGAMTGSSVAAKQAAAAILLTLSEHGDLLADVAGSGVLGPLTRLLSLLTSATAERLGGAVMLVLSRLASWSSSGGGPTAYSLPVRHVSGESVILQVLEPLVQALMVGTESGAQMAEKCLKALVKERDAWKEAIGQRLVRAIRSAAAVASTEDCVEVGSVVRALSGLAREGPSREMLSRAGVIPPLVDLLKLACSEAEKGQAAAALDLLMAESEGSLQLAIDAGAVPVLLNIVCTAGEQGGFRAAMALASILRAHPELHGLVMPTVAELLSGSSAEGQKQASRLVQAICEADTSVFVVSPLIDSFAFVISLHAWPFPSLSTLAHRAHATSLPVS